MRKFPLSGDDAKPDSPIMTIQRDALGPILTLDAAPTTAGGQLPNGGDIGFFGTNLYINLAGTVMRFSGTAV